MIRRDLEFKKRWLQWILDFVQMDLDSLSKSRKKELVSEIAYFCSDDLFQLDWEDWEYNVSFHVEEGENLLRTYVDRDTIDVLQGIGIDEEDGAPYQLEREIDPASLQGTLKEFIQTITAMQKPGEERPVVYHLPEMSSLLFVGWKSRADQGNFSEGYFSVSSHPRDNTLGNWGIINLTKLLEGLEVHSIRKCPGCARYFLNLTRKKKVYCNSACASRSIAHKKYEELKKTPKKYRAYLKKYRKYSIARYERMRKEQFGPNVKIKRRPKDRKEG